MTEYPLATWQRCASEKIEHIFEKIEHIFDLEVDNRWNEISNIVSDMSASYDEVIVQTNSLENVSLSQLYYKKVLLWDYLAIKSIAALRSIDIEITKAMVLYTLISKQRDYGKNNISRFGSSGLLIRVHDKLARIQNILERSKNNIDTAMSLNSVKDESIVDTFVDVIGYSIIGLMWLSIDENSGLPEFMLPLV